jgi:coniferyl-aldehyde dehydrogenase
VAANADDRRRPLRVVVDPAPDSMIMREEIFGPAMVVLTYDELNCVLDDINARPRPLALYYFGEDPQSSNTYWIAPCPAGSPSTT